MRYALRRSHRLAAAFAVAITAATARTQDGATPPAPQACLEAAMAATPSRPVLTPDASSVFAAGEPCLRVWIDSLRSADAIRAAASRNALVLMGGRAAVDALRADDERAPSRATRMAVIQAMASTGSPADVEFLMGQLGGAFTGNSDVWGRTTAAANSLALLRAPAARDSLAAALARNPGSNTFSGRAVQNAIDALDRPPCADSVSGELPAGLIRIVMKCRPQALWPTSRYVDQTTGGIWAFDNDTWREVPRVPSDSATMSTITNTVVLGADGVHATVSIATHCGRLCGEGWTYRLMRTGALWRVVGMQMVWVS